MHCPGRMTNGDYVTHRPCDRRCDVEAKRRLTTVINYTRLEVHVVDGASVAATAAHDVVVT